MSYLIFFQFPKQTVSFSLTNRRVKQSGLIRDRPMKSEFMSDFGKKSCHLLEVVQAQQAVKNVTEEVASVIVYCCRHLTTLDNNSVIQREKMCAVC